MMHWLSQVRRRAHQGWTAPPGTVEEGPLLDSAFLQRLEHLSLRVGRTGTSGLAGEHASRRKAHSVEFADYRDYRPGDDFRLIDWNVYARLGELTLRLTEATEATTLHLLLDCSASMAWGVPSKLRAMQRLAAALGCIALSRYDGVSVGVLRGGDVQCLPRLRGKNETGRFLAILEGLRPWGRLDLPAAAGAYCRAPRRGVAVLISDLLAPSGVAQAVSYLRRAGLATTVAQVLAREEAAPRLEGPLDLVDCETGAVLTTAVNGEMLRAYAERFDAWTTHLQEACAAHRACFVRLYTDQPLEDALFGALRGQVVQ
jgi:uncharacterized protein (DUF58 family)